MYKKSTSTPKREKPAPKEQRSSEKPKFSREKKSFDKKEGSFSAKPYKKFEKKTSSANADFSAGADFQSVPNKKRFGTDYKSAPARKPSEKPKFNKAYKSAPTKISKPKKVSDANGIRLNKYIANAGICSRREADTLIESGVVRINGVICTQLGTRVMPNDKVEFGGETLVSEKKVYLLMNKPKGYITTSDDPQERKTVMHLIEGACKERIYPVGRLDRQTTGVLLFTNDGEMAKRLTHPSHGVRKIYHVTLDKNITKTDLQTIAKGVELEDGFVPVDEINLIAGTKNEIGIQLHSGMNRVVRRIFEKFDYNVTKLDRVLFAELTKKDLPRGHWRILTDKEISFLKMK
ncbi:MAG: rRNA pseudouridine synthase [Bacteroidales bacterium]|jgi:23S rRNA pseudouridine2605 synthase|nr:rRNA pseudouridine synthase [Bacteroidales bacterium]